MVVMVIMMLSMSGRLRLGGRTTGSPVLRQPAPDAEARMCHHGTAASQAMLSAFKPGFGGQVRAFTAARHAMDRLHGRGDGFVARLGPPQGGGQTLEKVVQFRVFRDATPFDAPSIRGVWVFLGQ